MQIRYTRHAEDRMVDRDVTRADVEECLQNYMQRISGRKVEYKGRARGKVLKVGVAPDVDTDDEKLITTVMWEGR